MLDLKDCTFAGHALPEPFVQLELEGRLAKAGLLPKPAALAEEWDVYRRSLRRVGLGSGSLHVTNHVLSPLAAALGYGSFSRQEEVATREGDEDGGFILEGNGDARLRAFAFDLGADLDAPTRRGHAYRFSPERIAQRVLLSSGERVALLTNGLSLRLLLCDPARPESHVGFRLDRGSGGWAARPRVPDSYRVLRALASPAGLALLPELVEAARLHQTAVTKSLRLQAREAVEGFVQEVLDHPENAQRLAGRDHAALPKELWREGLVLVYRLLFTLKLEASADPARAFSFASTSLWRGTYSPNARLGPIARDVIDSSAETGRLLEDGLRTAFRLFAHGVSSSELKISALGGALFGQGTTTLLDSLRWGERAVARLLVSLLWAKQKHGPPLRVHYGTLDVEDLGRVYESLLELEPGIAAEPMCRLRRQKLEVVVSLAQGEPYRKAAAPAENGEGAEGDEDEGDEDEEPRGKKTKVLWIEKIEPGRFFLRVGLGRKATGSYYTPHPFVRFLVQETLDPQVKERSPLDDPRPNALLSLKVLDPAMGSGHFLVEACRSLGEKLYEACRRCDELALLAEEAGDAPRAAELRRRVEELPDPEDQMLAYLPSRVAEGEEAGLSQAKALALSRRLVAVHCLYGVDKNPLAVELAKLALWLESYSEGLPLTFLDHRLTCGDSLTGPMFEHLLTDPGSGQKLDDLFTSGLKERLTATLNDALENVKQLEASVGKDVADLEAKRAAKERLDAALAPFRLLAAAWSGGVMLGREKADGQEYEALLKAVAAQGDAAAAVAGSPSLAQMVATGREGVPYDIVFPEVFWRGGARGGFDAVLGNPPWDAIQFKTKEFFASFDFKILDAPTKRERTAIEERLLADHACGPLFEEYKEAFERLKRANDALCEYQKVEVEGDLAGRQVDAFRVFMERNAKLLGPSGRTGVLVPSAFHANEGATGIRKLYLEEMALQCCYSFENLKKLFEIHASFKFALVVARKPGPTMEFLCAFYLRDMDWLFGDRSGRELTYSFGFVRKTGGNYLRLLELKSEADFEVARALYGRSEELGRWSEKVGIVMQQMPASLHSTKDAWRLRPLANSGGVVAEVFTHALLVHEGKTFRDFEDRWGVGHRYVLPLSNASGLDKHLIRAQGFQLVVRRISSATNERTLISAIVPPNAVLMETSVDAAVFGSRHSDRLIFCALVNSCPMDWLGRQSIATTVSLFILNSLALPRLGETGASFLSHAALRLTCNHTGYAPLWREQVGDEWREPKPPFTWPVLEGDDARWAVRAAIDAVVADAYGLSREQYAHVLSTFSHKSYPKAPGLCLAAFDELKALGLDAFTKKHDPYWDIPLNESLPKPVIDIPTPASTGQLGLGLDEASGTSVAKRGHGRPQGSMARKS